MYNYICIYIYIYIHVCVYIYIHTCMHYITFQDSSVQYITVHYITYITLHYLTLHYITLHIYISLSAYGTQKKMCSNCVRYVAVIFFVYTF